MSKIKEIKKIESNIKEIKKEKVESLEEEVDEDFEIEEPSFNNGFRRFNRTSTLDANEIPQESVRERRVAKEDEKEINFRPSYTGGGNPYQGKSYTPVGAAESGASRDNRQVESSLDNRNGLQRTQEQQQTQMGGERRGEVQYAGEREQQERKERRKNM